MGKGPMVAGLILLVLFAGGAYALTSNSGNDTASNNSSNSTEQSSSQNMASEDSNNSDDANVAATITYDGSSFSPDNITVKSGDKVTVKNDSDQQLEFASDPHPVHTDDTDLNAGDEDPGKSKTFTVTKKGTFGFHNHYNQSQRGQITIE